MSAPVRVLAPGKERPCLDLSEFHRHRELLYFLAWKEVRLRYRQTALGVAWAVLQPALELVLFVLLFGRVLGLGERVEGSYTLTVLTGIVLWNYFSNSVANGAGALLASANLVTKVYFPRLLIPAAAVLAGLVDLGVGVGLLLLVMPFVGHPVSWTLLLFPVSVVGVVALALGVGAVLASLTVVYRDFRYVLPFLLRVWFFLTPVVYPIGLVPEPYRWLLALNPLTGLVEGFRACVLPGTAWHPGTVAYGLLLSLLALLAGMAYFRRAERSFADVI